MPDTTCIPITQEKVRAELWMGTDLLLSKTPFIKSFNVGKARGQLTNTFNITFEMLAGTVFSQTDKIVIKAGVKGDLKTIFTGYIEATKSSPIFGKPSYFSILLSGRGVLSQLENKKFSRRLKSDGQGMFCLIKSGGKNRPSKGTSLDRGKSSGNTTVMFPTPDPASSTGGGSAGGGEHSQLNVYNAPGTNQAAGGIAARVAGRPVGGSEDDAQGGGLGIHTHESNDQGGPAFGVYSAD